MSHFHISPSGKPNIAVIPGYAIGHSITPRTSWVGRPSTLRILNIGRAEPRKGIPALFAACASLRRQGVPFSLTVASPVKDLKTDNSLDIYEALNLFSQVRFYHAVDEKQKRQLFSATDIFVIPSQALETFGLTIIESLSHGVPVIGTPIGAIPEILQKVDRRLITAGATGNDIATTVLWYHRLSQKQKEALRKKSLACIQNHYTKQHVIPKLFRVYGEL